MKTVSLVLMILLMLYGNGCRSFFEPALSSCLGSSFSVILYSIYDPYKVESFVDSSITREQVNSIAFGIKEKELFGLEFLDSVRLTEISQSIEKNIYENNPYILTVPMSRDYIKSRNLNDRWYELLDKYDSVKDSELVKILSEMSNADCFIILEVSYITRKENLPNSENPIDETSSVNLRIHMFSGLTGKLIWKASVCEETEGVVPNENLSNDLIIPAVERVFEKFPLRTE